MPVFNLFNSVLRGTQGAISGISNIGASVVGAVDPKMGRLLSAGLNKGGRARSRGSLQKVDTRTTFSGMKEVDDWRVRVSVGENSGILYQDTRVGNILKPLIATKGVIFPYTPKVDITLQSQYSDTEITHTNYGFQSYNRSNISSVTISAEFTAQTPEEAQYVLAVIHFFRAAGKMFTGKDDLAGNPPPLLFLDGYGQYYLPHVPCVLTQFGHTMPDDVDYISAPSLDIKEARKSPTPPGEPDSEYVAGASSIRTKIPTLSAMNITLQPVYSRSKVAEFSTEAFARGEYLKKGYI